MVVAKLMQNDSDGFVSKLSGIKTKVLVAWIFSLMFLVFWAAGFVYYFIIWFVLGMFGLTNFGGLFLAMGLVYGVTFLVLLIPSVLVFRRISRMKKAADTGDITTLGRLNSVGWGVVALISNCIIPGVLLFMVHRSITQPRKSKHQVTSPSTGATSEVLEQIVKLKGLMDSGALTREEFNEQKNLILHPENSLQPSEVESEIHRAKSLYDSRVLTPDEYNGIKKRLLAKI